jgi:iron complex outermembrane receptor protein
VLAASAVSGSAIAQDKTTLLEEIVVTAQKRQESLQEVPIAISVFTSEARDKLGIITLQDFTDFTPGVTYSTSLDRMSIRGIGRQTNNLATSSSVATYGDGFYNSSNHQADTSTMFTEQVDVLRGPQGTLYGRNSIGGTLNVKLKRPKNEWGGEARAIIGNFGREEIEGTFTGPLTDWLRFRVGAGLYTQQDGYVNNIVPGKDDGYGQKNDKFMLLMLEGNIGESIDWFLKYAHSEWDEGYGTSVNLAPYNTFRACTVVTPTCRASLVATGSLGPSALFNTGTGLNPANPQYTTVNPGTLDPRAVNWDTPSHNTLIPDNITVLEVVGHLGFADLKYIGGYHDYEYILNSDFDNSDRFSYQYTGPAATDVGCTPTTCNNTPLTIYSQVISTYIENKKYYSNELNLISTGDSSFQWVGGLYQYHEYYEQPVDTFNPNQTQLRTPLLGPANPKGSFQYTDAHTTTDSLAAFGQVDWQFTESLKATLGLRYTKDTKSGDEFIRRVSWNPTLLGPFATAFDITGLAPASGGFNSPTIGAHATNDGSGTWTRSYDHDWDATTGTAGLQWTPMDGANTYLRYTRGYKDGGVNAGGLVPLANLYTDAEYVDAYEFGWKQEIGGQFTANLSVFYYDYQGAQYPLTLVSTSGLGTNSQIFNIDSLSRGAELETVWRPTTELQLMLNYAFLDTHIKDRNCYSKSTYTTGVDPKACGNPTPSGGPVYIFGNDVPGSPENKISFNAMYTFEFSPGKLSLSGSYVWRDTQYSSILGGNEWVVPSYGKTDFRAIWTDTDNSYSVIAYLRNAGDTEGFDGVTAATGSSGITQSYSLTPPRQYGLELQYRFGSAK